MVTLGKSHGTGWLLFLARTGTLFVVRQGLLELTELSHAFGYPPVLAVDGLSVQGRSDQHAERKQQDCQQEEDVGHLHHLRLHCIRKRIG